ncbi:MAG TPA: hypothetical protein VGM10_35650 [Actinocrinis sp.]
MASKPGKQGGGAQQRRIELERLRAEQARAERRRKIVWGSGAGLLAAVLVAGLVWLGVSKDHGSSSSMSTTNSAANTSGDTSPANSLAPVWKGLTGQSVDGVTSNNSEQLAYHIHAHLSIYVNGTQKIVPYGIGIVGPWATEQTSDGPFVDSGSAFYYLHTHDATGVIHIESPTQKTYTLGQFFAEWNQPLSGGQVGPAKGQLTVYVDGAAYTGNPADISLTAHKVIQIDVGKVVPFQPYTFASGL